MVIGSTPLKKWENIFISVLVAQWLDCDCKHFQDKLVWSSLGEEKKQQLTLL